MLEKEFLQFLEAESIRMLLCLIDVDSYILKNVLDWGLNYLQTHRKSTTLKSFLTETGINKFLTGNCFETMKSFLDFCEMEPGKSFFSETDICQVVKTLHCCPRRSCWVKMKENDVLTEEFIVKDVAFLENYITELKIYRCKTVFLNLPEIEGFKSAISSYTLVFDGSNNKKDIKEFFCASKAVVKNPFSLIKIEGMNLISDVIITARTEFKSDCRILKKSAIDIIPLKLGESFFYVDCVKIGWTKKQ